MKNYSQRSRSKLKSITFTLLLVIIARLKEVQCSANGRFYIFSGSGSSLPPEDVISSHNIDDDHTEFAQLQCALLCDEDEKCVAYNFRVKRKNKHDVNCQLSNTTKQRKEICDEEWKLFRDADTMIESSTNVNVVNQFHVNFTNLGANGKHGPTSRGSHYVGKDHENMVTVLNGKQFWTVPYTGTYEITAVGAAGGYDKHSASSARGRGAYMRGEFALNKGDVVKVLVGQQGVENVNSRSSGGGGGSFVATSSDTPLIVAGGGGGLDYLVTRLANCDASTGTPGKKNQCKNPCKIWSGGVNGSGALERDNKYSGGGGGGFYSNGWSSRYGVGGGRGFIQGGTGGRSRYNNADGGFGGGGGAYGYGRERGGGGGGGYSGGAAGFDATKSCGGGGGSYNIGKNQQNKDGYWKNGHGYVEIKLLA